MEQYQVEGFVIDFVHEPYCEPIHCPEKDKMIHKASRSTYCYAYNAEDFKAWREQLSKLRDLAESNGISCRDVTLKRPKPVAKVWSSCNMTSEDPITGRVDVFDRETARNYCFARIKPILNALRGRQLATDIKNRVPAAVQFSLQNKVDRLSALRKELPEGRQRAEVAARLRLAEQELAEWEKSNTPKALTSVLREAAKQAATI